MIKRTSTLIIMLFACSLTSCTAQTKVFTEPVSSMEPTILQGEKFTVEMQSFQPTRGDLVVFQHEGILIAKRVLGVGGDVVEGHDSQVTVNGKALREPYIQHIGQASGSLVEFGPIKVPVGQLFVAGDNRDYSLDSRDSRFGLLSISDVKGKPVKVVASSNPKRVNTILH